MTQALPGAAPSLEIAPAILRPGPIALPLRFCAPPGWPQPSRWWVATHQGWRPPAGWTLEPGLAEAPRDWVWWQRDERTWAASTRAFAAQYRRGIVIGLAVSLVALGFLLAPSLAHSGVRSLLWGGLLFGPAEVARDVMGLVTLGRRYDALARRRSARLAAMPQPLVDQWDEGRLAAFFTHAADDGAGLGAADAAAPGSVTGVAAGSTATATVKPGTDAPLALGRRIATMLVAVAFAVALIFLLADAFTASTMGSGAH